MESPPHFLPQADLSFFFCFVVWMAAVVSYGCLLAPKARSLVAAYCLLLIACCLLLVAYFVRCYLPLWHNGAYLHKSISLAFNNLNNTRTMRAIEVDEWLWCAQTQAQPSINMWMYYLFRYASVRRSAHQRFAPKVMLRPCAFSVSMSDI